MNQKYFGTHQNSSQSKGFNGGISGFIKAEHGENIFFLVISLYRHLFRHHKDGDGRQ